MGRVGAVVALGLFSFVACTSPDDGAGAAPDAAAPDPPAPPAPEGDAGSPDAATDPDGSVGGPPGLSLLAGGLGGAGQLAGVGTDARVPAAPRLGYDASGKRLFVGATYPSAFGVVDAASRAVSFTPIQLGDAGSAAFGLGGVPAWAYDATANVLYTGGYPQIRTVDVATGAIGTLADVAGAVSKLTFDPAGHVLYAVRGSGCVIDAIRTTSGAAIGQWGGACDTASKDGAANAATFRGPLSVTVDASGDKLYVSDADTLRVIDTAGGGVTTVATVANGLVAFSAKRSSVLLLDLARTVRAIDVVTGNVTVVAGPFAQGSEDGASPAGALWSPATIALGDADDRLYVSDLTAVRAIDLVKNEVTTFAGAMPHTGNVDAIGAAARFNRAFDPSTPGAQRVGPRGVAYDATRGVAFVADSGNLTLRAIDLATAAVSTIAGTVGVSAHVNGGKGNNAFKQLRGLADDAARNTLFIADGSMIRALDVATGVTSTVVGTETPGMRRDGSKAEAVLGDVAAIAVGPGNALYFTDGNAIRMVDRQSGETITITGSTLASPGSGDADGDAAVAKFSADLPAIAFDASRNVLFVADRGNKKIRRVDLASRMTTTSKADVDVTALAFDASRSVLVVATGTGTSTLDPTTGSLSPVFAPPAGQRGVRLGAFASASTNRASAVAVIAPGDVLLTDEDENVVLRARGF